MNTAQMGTREQEEAGHVEARRPARIKRREVEDKLGKRPEGLRLQDLEIMADFIFLGSKISADGDCNH